MRYKVELEFFADDEKDTFDQSLKEAFKAGAKSTNTDLRVLSMLRLPEPKPEPPKVLKKYRVTVRRRQDAYCDITVDAYDQKEAYDKAYDKIDDHHMYFEVADSDYDLYDIEEDDGSW